MLGHGLLLTGGGSRRMGVDKASIDIDGVSLAERIAGELSAAGLEVTVLGRHPIPGCAFLEDSEEYAGALANLRRFAPSHDAIFVASCDLPCFQRLVPQRLLPLLGDVDAVLPVLDGRPQYLVGWYTKLAFELLATNATLTRMQNWAALLRTSEPNEANLEALGLQLDWLRGANTPEEYQAIMSRARVGCKLTPP